MFTLTEVECLGGCVNAPILQVDDDYYEDLDYDRTVRADRGAEARRAADAGLHHRAPDQRAGGRAADRSSTCRESRGMALSDKDRIFTNLYGLHDWRLAAARRRGHWDGTAEHHRQGPRLDHRAR